MMNKAKGTVHKFGDNVDTDVIIPARYLNKSDDAWLASLIAWRILIRIL